MTLQNNTACGSLLGSRIGNPRKSQIPNRMPAQAKTILSGLQVGERGESRLWMPSAFDFGANWLGWSPPLSWMPPFWALPQLPAARGVKVWSFRQSVLGECKLQPSSLAQESLVSPARCLTYPQAFTLS